MPSAFSPPVKMAPSRRATKRRYPATTGEAQNVWTDFGRLSCQIFLPVVASTIVKVPRAFPVSVSMRARFPCAAGVQLSEPQPRALQSQAD